MTMRVTGGCFLVAWMATVAAASATTTRRQGDVWQIESDRICVSVDPIRGSIGVLDKVGRYEWLQPEQKRGTPATHGKAPAPKFRRVRGLPTDPKASGATGPGIAFEADLGATAGRPNAGTVSLTVPTGSDTLIVTLDMPDRDIEAHHMPFLDPFVLDAPRGVMAVADYCNGHVYPVDGYPTTHTYHAADRLDMPWVGLCDLDRGFGWLMIIDTSDNAHVHFKHYDIGGKKLAAPKVIWVSSKRKFAYPRRLIHRFLPKGGYVALAKAFRAYARDRGLLVTLSQKAERNPNLRRLFGAPDVWGDATLAFARRAQAAGVDKMLVHGRSTSEQTRGINELEFLTSEYDNYTDILPLEKGREIDAQHAPLPESAVLKADGKRMTAWLTFDKKRQYMKRCPSLWVKTARVVVPKVLREYPYLGRFIDVTTAEGLYECFDPKHPLTKAQKRQCGMDLLSYVRSQRLVVGGEHGIWWAVPHLDYIEGMMSGSPWCYPWPAGHLIHPKTKDQAFTSPWGGKLARWEQYETWSMGHRWRAPLWELVFHDCIVSTWYWGDASDWLLEAAPEVTAKKDAFNVLYGTIPMMWANKAGSWHADRETFLRTYRNTCKLHEAIAGTEMLSHAFVTPDHAVQRTRFSDGTDVVVNFGAKPYTAEVGGRAYALPQNGFAVKGPLIEQSLTLVDGKPVASIKTRRYRFTDGGAVATTLRAVARDRLRVRVAGGARAIAIRPADVAAHWDLASTRVYALDAAGERTDQAAWRRFEDGRVAITPPPETTCFDVVCGSKAGLADLAFGPTGVALTPSGPKQGQEVIARVDLLNVGGAEADVDIGFYADSVRWDRRLTGQAVGIAPGETRTIAVKIDTSSIDGPRRILVVADPANEVPELCERNNTRSCCLEVQSDIRRWSRRRQVRVETGGLAREDEPVIVPIELPGVDPGSVRVATCDAQGRPGALVPAQLDVGKDGRTELCFLMVGKAPAQTTRRFWVLWNDAKRRVGAVLSPPNSMWDATACAIEGANYRVVFEDGALVRLATRRDGVADEPFLAKLVVSSKETGFVDEPGSLRDFEVRFAGPVRTRVFVRKALAAGVVYEKTYTFYPRWFDLIINVNKGAGGLYSRGFYLREATYVNDKDARGKIDGQGRDEGIYGKGKDPKWFAVFAADWAHSCVALSAFDHVCYWDDVNWGGIGLVTKATKGIAMRYVFHSGATSADFAKRDQARAASPVKATVE